MQSINYASILTDPLPHPAVSESAAEMLSSVRADAEGAVNRPGGPALQAAREFRNFPGRDENGILVLQSGHFGLPERIYLFALIDLVRGVSNQASADRMMRRLGVHVSRCTIRDSFRGRLYQNIRRFAGDLDHLSFVAFCGREGLGNPFSGGDNNQVAFCMARYLLEVFDLYEPVRVEMA